MITAEKMNPEFYFNHAQGGNRDACNTCAGTAGQDWEIVHAGWCPIPIVLELLNEIAVRDRALGMLDDADLVADLDFGHKDKTDLIESARASLNEEKGKAK